MFKYLRDAQEIVQAQSNFRKRFESVGEKRQVKVGYKGQTDAIEVTWLTSGGIWTGSRILHNRYWNAFGVGEPHGIPGSNSITCEINFPLQGVNPRIAGVLAKDDQDVIWVLHRGRIGGGRTGVGPKLFRDNFGGKWTSVEGDDVVEISAISAPDFITLVSRFVNDVHNMKPNP